MRWIILTIDLLCFGGAFGAVFQYTIFLFSFPGDHVDKIIAVIFVAFSTMWVSCRFLNNNPEYLSIHKSLVEWAKGF
jgi:hypothetical protein